MPKQADQARRVGKFWGPAKAAMNFIEAAEQLLVGALQRRGVQCPAGIALIRVEAGERILQCQILFLNLRSLYPVGVGDAVQQIAECRQSMTCFTGEIGAGEEGCLIIRRQEHGKRPSPGTLREKLVSRLVDIVQIGPLLAVYFDVDVEFVHQRRGRFVFE